VTQASGVVSPFGDEALLITLGDSVDPALGRHARAIASSVEAAAARGLAFGTPVCGYATVLVPFDPLALDPDRAALKLRQLVADTPGAGADASGSGNGPLVEIPTRYGGADGEDLGTVAEQVGLSPDAVVEIHASIEYEVFMLGFSPGFAYLGVVPEEIAVSRRASPRPRVHAGSVAIAERQTAVYPVETPGGWQVIGRTELVLWDPTRPRPALLAPGDRVRFVPVR